MPLSNLPLRQQHFDTALNHLRKQGGQSTSPGDKTCFYRGAQGSKCAIGALIPDSMYDDSMENNAVTSLLREFPEIESLLTVIDPLDAEFYSDMQYELHDSLDFLMPPNGCMTFHEALEYRAKSFAKKYGIKYSAH